MFWDDAELVKRRDAGLRALPPVQGNWKTPQYFPNLSQADVIALDCETYDPGLTDHGPGWGRGTGHIVGISIAARRGIEQGKWYFPIRHTIETEYNLNTQAVFAWLRETLHTPHIPKVGANLLYDVGWLTTENIYVEGQLYDVQFAEALIDNEGFTALDFLGEKYLGIGKTTDALYDWLNEAYPNDKAAPRKNIYRAPPALVGPYAEDDADLPLQIIAKQWPIMEREGLLPLFHVECNLITLLVRMRLNGVPIDLDYAEQFYTELSHDIRELYKRLSNEAGVPVTSASSPQQLARVFTAHGVEFPHTDAGNPSFKKEWLEAQTHPIAELVQEIREHEKIRGTFIKGYLLDGHVNSKVHCSFHPLRAQSSGGKSGAKTGRFSSSDPNLQNIPVRSKLGARVRKAFKPKKRRWRKYDYSQIEYRMLAHYAVDNGDGSANALRANYLTNPDADYHDIVQANVLALTGIKIDRRPIKNINFGLLYGQSEKALANKAGFSSDQAHAVFEAYHQGATYVKPSMEMCANEAAQRGYITTIAGRRARFHLWEPVFRRGAIPLPYDAALKHYGAAIQIAYAYRAVNYKLQGSAADVIKYAMEQASRSGVFDVIGVPLLQVHDELDFDEDDETPARVEAYRELEHIMTEYTRAALGLRIPVAIDCKTGLTWGDID